MIQKINRFTIFKNYFTKVGRNANEEIRKMDSYLFKGDIYQKNLKNGKIVLQHDQKLKGLKKTTTMILNQEGIQNIITRDKHTSYYKKGFERLIINKKDPHWLVNKQKEVLYNTVDRKIEEKAVKISGEAIGSALNVISYADRKTLFPATELAGSMHPSMAKRSVYPDGSVEYIEKYPNL